MTSSTSSLGPADRAVLKSLRETVWANMPEAEYAETVDAVTKAGSIRNTAGLHRVLIEKAVTTVVKGDYVGHPFRGNQWTTAEGQSRGGARSGRGEPSGVVPDSLIDQYLKANSDVDSMLGGIIADTQKPDPRGKNPYDDGLVRSARIKLKDARAIGLHMEEGKTLVEQAADQFERAGRPDLVAKVDTLLQDLDYAMDNAKQNLSDAIEITHGFIVVRAMETRMAVEEELKSIQEQKARVARERDAIDREREAARARTRNGRASAFMREEKDANTEQYNALKAAEGALKQMKQRLREVEREATRSNDPDDLEESYRRKMASDAKFLDDLSIAGRTITSRKQGTSQSPVGYLRDNLLDGIKEVRDMVGELEDLLTDLPATVLETAG